MFVLLVITFITYLIFFVMPPTDPAVIFAGKQPTPELVAQVRVQFGLNHPWPVQYALFVKRIFLGDQWGWPAFAFSFYTRSGLRVRNPTFIPSAKRKSVVLWIDIERLERDIADIGPGPGGALRIGALSPGGWAIPAGWPTLLAFAGRGRRSWPAR